jgi:hypothetical protein
MHLKTIALALLVFFPGILFSQEDDWEDDDYYDYSESEPTSIYEVAACENNLSGLIRTADKKLMIPCSYTSIVADQSANGEDENYFVVTNSNELKGLYSIRDAKEIIPCKYTWIESFYYDFYPNDDNNPDLFCAFIAETSNTLGTPKDYFARNGKLVISTSNDMEWSIKVNPNILMGMFYDHDNYAIKNGYFIFNSQTGEQIQNRTCSISEYNSDQAIIEVNGKFGFIDMMTGNYILKPEYDSLFFYPNIIGYKNGKVELLNSDGLVILPLGLYDKIGYTNCINDLCAINVSKNGKWGCVDEGNKVILPLQYDMEFDFADTMWVLKNHKWGAINSKGIEINPFEYDSLIFESYDNYDIWDSIYFDYLSVKKNGKWGCIYTNGTKLMPMQYDLPVSYADTMFVVENGKWKCIDKDLKNIVNFTFDTDTSCVKSMRFSTYGVLINDEYNYTDYRNTLDFGVFEQFKIVEQGDKMNLKLCLQFIKPDEKEWLLMHALDLKKYDLFCIIALSKPDFNEFNESTNVDAPMCRVVGAIIYCGNILMHDDKSIVLMLNALVKAGADPNQLDRFGNTPLTAYLSRRTTPDIEVVKILLAAGAKVKMKDSSGKNALYYAKDATQPVIDLLSEYKKLE